jgi:hypothetical protein
MKGGCGTVNPPSTPGSDIAQNLENGAPRPMKMGTIASPWRYDAAARHAL